MIEYSLVLILVILGIVIMGPYVLRAVDAHFKLWDQGVKDSFTEHLKQDDSVQINLTSNCICTSTPGLCGNPTGTYCGAGFREFDTNCNIQGCNGAAGDAYCVSDTSCCGYHAAGCGDFTCLAGGCAVSPTNPPPSSDDCYWGQQKLASDCADLPIRCQVDNNCPLPTCLGQVPGPDAQHGNQNPAYFCATDSTTPPANPNLLQKTWISYAGNGKASCPATPGCALYCNFPYVLNADGTACVWTPPCCNIVYTYNTSMRTAFQRIIPTPNGTPNGWGLRDQHDLMAASYFCELNGFHYLIDASSQNCTWGCSKYGWAFNVASGNWNLTTTSQPQDLCPSVPINTQCPVGNETHCGCPPFWCSGGPNCNASGVCDTSYTTQGGLCWSNGSSYMPMMDRVACSNLTYCIPSDQGACTCPSGQSLNSQGNCA